MKNRPHAADLLAIAHEVFSTEILPVTSGHKRYTALMIANAMAPAGQADRLVDVAVAESAAGMGPIAMHGNPAGMLQRAESEVGPGRMLSVRGLPERKERGNRMAEPERAASGPILTFAPLFWTRLLAKVRIERPLANIRC